MPIYTEKNDVGQRVPCSWTRETYITWAWVGRNMKGCVRVDFSTLVCEFLAEIGFSPPHIADFQNSYRELRRASFSFPSDYPFTLQLTWDIRGRVLSTRTYPIDEEDEFYEALSPYLPQVRCALWKNNNKGVCHYGTYTHHLQDWEYDPKSVGDLLDFLLSFIRSGYGITHTLIPNPKALY